MEGIKNLNPEEIIDHLLEDRGLDVNDAELRSQYPMDLILKAKSGDSEALVRLLKIGLHHSVLGKIESV